MTIAAFKVHGLPIPQGSKKAFKVGNNINLVESSKKLPAWRNQITNAATLAMGAKPAAISPIRVDVIFWMPEPKKPKWWAPAVRPDLDKLCRSLLDGMTGIIFKDDCQVVSLHAEKRYTTVTKIGAEVWVYVAQPE